MMCGRFLIFTGFIFFSGLIVMQGCGKQPGDSEYKYYRVVDTSPIYKIIPKYPAKKEYAEEGACWELRYDKRGRLKDASYVKNGTLAEPLYNNYAQIAIEYGRGFEARTFYDKYGELIQLQPEISKTVYRFNDSGKFISYEFLDEQGNLIEDSLGAAKYIYLDNNDSTNSLVELRLNAQGDTIVDDHGIYRKIIQLNEQGYVIKSEFFNKSNQVTNSSYGISSIRNYYDGDNNLIKKEFFDNHGDRAIDEIHDAAVIECIYDDYGYLKTFACYDKDMSLVDAILPGFAISSMTYAFNGILLNHKLIKADSSMIQAYIHDEKGRLLEMGYHDADGNYIINKEQGYAILRLTVDDETGLVTENHFLDENEKLIEPEFYGYAITKAEYNDKLQIVKIAFLGSDMQPRFNKQRGFASETFVYDENNNLAYINTYDAEGNLITDDDTASGTDN